MPQCDTNQNGAKQQYLAAFDFIYVGYSFVRFSWGEAFQ